MPKADIHPDYRLVVFEDTNVGKRFLTRSTAPSNETTEFEGETYPLVKVEISAESHPFFTGQMRIVDTAGRVERFERRYGSRRKKKGAAPEASADEATAQDTASEDAES